MNYEQLVQSVIGDTENSLEKFLPELVLCGTILLMLLSRLFKVTRQLLPPWFLAGLGVGIAFVLAEPWKFLGEGAALRKNRDIYRDVGPRCIYGVLPCDSALHHLHFYCACADFPIGRSREWSRFLYTRPRRCVGDVPDGGSQSLARSFSLLIEMASRAVLHAGWAFLKAIARAVKRR